MILKQRLTSRTELIRFAIEVDSHEIKTKVYDEWRVQLIQNQNEFTPLMQRITSRTKFDHFAIEMDTSD